MTNLLNVNRRGFVWILIVGCDAAVDVALPTTTRFRGVADIGYECVEGEPADQKTTSVCATRVVGWPELKYRQLGGNAI